jgi:hypothetical protein
VAASTGSGLAAFYALVLLVYIPVAIIAVLAWVKIISKAGYSGWWVLVALVPLLNLIMFLVFAFSDWPVRKQARGVAPLRRRDPG